MAIETCKVLNSGHVMTFSLYIYQHFTYLFMLSCCLWHAVQITDLISSRPVGSPLLKSTLSPSQWEIVEYISHALRQDYEVRRQMVIQRLDVTIQSFTWSDRIAVMGIFTHVFDFCQCDRTDNIYIQWVSYFLSHLIQASPDCSNASNKTSFFVIILRVIIVIFYMWHITVSGLLA